MRTVCIIGRKGGSGKSTIASQMAIGLHLRGRKTVLIDTDPQLSSLQVLSNRTRSGPKVLEGDFSRLTAFRDAAADVDAEAVLIDTPAVLEEAVSAAVALSNLCILVLRPTFLDLASAVRTSAIIREYRKPGLVLLNQAPPAREGVEPPIVRRSLEALKILKLPAVPVIIRARSVYQTALEQGLSAEELPNDTVAAQEMGELCAFVDRFLFGRSIGRPLLAAEGR